MASIQTTSHWQQPDAEKASSLGIPWRRLITTVAVMASVGALLYHFIDIDEVHARAEEMPGVLAFALLVILPLFGIPASILHVAAGIRFGLWWGFALVVASIALQIIASYFIVRCWRERLERTRWIQNLRQRIPPGAHASVCAFTVLLPGAPFAAVNYTLPLLGVPLRTLLLCALPLHALRATITVGFGGQSHHLTATRLAVMGAYALLILGTCWWTYRRLQSRFSGQPPAADGRKQPA